MDYIRIETNGQLAFTQSVDYLMIPSCLPGFRNESTTDGITASGRKVICFIGTLKDSEEDHVCEYCGTKMHVNNHLNIMLRHLPFG